MSVDLSNTDALLLAVPMIGLMAVGFFRLDELVGKPKKDAPIRRQVAGLDAKGRQVCLDPDGTIPLVKKSGSAAPKKK